MATRKPIVGLSFHPDDFRNYGESFTLRRSDQINLINESMPIKQNFPEKTNQRFGSTPGIDNYFQTSSGSDFINWKNRW